PVASASTTSGAAHQHEDWLPASCSVATAWASTPRSPRSHSTDGYSALQRLGGGYGLLVWNPVLDFRAVAGARFEHFGQDIEATSPFVDPDDVEQATRIDNDVLPS